MKYYIHEALRICFYIGSALMSFLLLFSAPSLAQKDTLAAPYATKSVMNFAEVIGWDSLKPEAPAGFRVSMYANGFNNPRWLYVLPNGDVLVAESNSNMSVVQKLGAAVVGYSKAHNMEKSADRITLLRDENKDGIPEMSSIFLDSLQQPLGMLLINDWLYVANTNAVVRFPYKTGQVSINAAGQKIADLPSEGRHWTRGLVANADKTKLYVSVGSASNIAEDGIEKELLRACILEMNPDGSGLQVFAGGLRNPVGMDWAPGTETLWTVVNERDELGDELVPDYLTSVKKNGFYGWPYTYMGQHIDPRVKDQKPELVKKAIVPETGLGPHTASLGLEFYTAAQFPKKYQGGAFITQHGSWNRSTLSGYKVVYVPFKNGKPTGPPEDFLTGFIVDPAKNEVRGRPVGIVTLPDGSLLITDDTSNTVWRITYGK